MRLILPAAITLTLAACSQGDYVDELVEKRGRAIDNCDLAYGQGRLAKPKSLAEEGSSKFLPSSATVTFEPHQIIVTIKGTDQKCRLDPNTYAVVEKL